MRRSSSRACWTAVRSSISPSRPLASPLAIMCTMSGGKSRDAPSARARLAPSCTRAAASASAWRSGRFDTTPAPAFSAVSSGTRLPTRIASVAARRAELRPAVQRPDYRQAEQRAVPALSRGGHCEGEPGCESPRRRARSARNPPYTRRKSDSRDQRAGQERQRLARVLEHLHHLRHDVDEEAAHDR